MASRFLRLAGTGGLPIFRQDSIQYSSFDAPGFLCVVPRSGSERFEAELGASMAFPWGSKGPGEDWAYLLCLQAEQAVAETDRLHQEAFCPECLTLYLNNECNLRCGYCYSAPSRRPAERLSLKTVCAAAEVVAKNCRQKQNDFYVVFQGGGEPTLDDAQIGSALALVESVASDYGVKTFRYLATNGVMPEKRAVWVARSFDLVGISCDGPADIHDGQRTNWEGQGSSSSLERTVNVLKEEGQPLHVRVTITSRSFQHQAEIAEYLCQNFEPVEIIFEPVYFGGRADGSTALDVDQAGEFVNEYLKARAVTDLCGVKLSTSGSRADEIHGPFCNVFRQVLNLVPAKGMLAAAPQRETGSADVATACFKTVDAAHARAKGTTVGGLNPQTGHFEIDGGQVRLLRERLSFVPEKCENCFNLFHCAGDCPDRCLLVADDRALWGTGFRCRMQKTLMAALLEQAAERLWGEMLVNGIEGPHGTKIP
jgi:sulfatase maturation enzyme AslB (radical SAM superfamily)